MIRRVQLGLLSVAAISFITALVLASSARDAMAAPNLVTNGDFATDHHRLDRPAGHDEHLGARPGERCGR